MIITCKVCNTSFNLDDKMLKPTGSKVRCSVCSKVFTAFPPQTPPHVPAVDTAVPATASKPEILFETGAAAVAAKAPNQPETPMTAVPEIEDELSDLLDEDLAEASLESEPAPDLALESDTSDESDASILAGLDDDDLNLDLSPEPADEEGSATVIAELGEDDLDLSLVEKPETAQTVMVDLDREALDLDGDFSYEPEQPAKSALAAEKVQPASTGDLDDLELSLELEPAGEAPMTEGTGSEGIEASLEELSLDFDLGADAGTAEAAPDAGTDLGDLDELDLTLELEDGSAGEKEQTAPASDLGDDLDLSGLEELLKDDEESEDDTATLVVGEGDDLDLSFEMEDETPAPGAGDTLADMEFDLDDAGKNESFGIDDADQEIDLSEIEKMLEEPEGGGAKFSSVPEQDLDLDIEASLETEKWMSESADDDQLVKDEELDLSELEQVLDDVDTDAADDTLEDAELELDLGEGKVSEKPDETEAVERELDFDLSDFEDEVPSQAGAKAAAREPEEMELEFEMEPDGRVEQTMEDEGLEETVAVVEPKAQVTPAIPLEADAERAEPATPAPKPKPVKKGISKSLVFLLIVAILGGVGYGTYYLLSRNNIDIPFLSDYLQPKVQDPGNLKLTTYDINSRFIDNANVGKLFVISGKVKNGYPENRGMITLVGRIFSTGKVPVHEETVYCGNVMSDLELTNLEWDKIKERLSNRLGDNRSNVKVEPGKSIPFMVVFSGLPDDLEEFNIEVTGSTSLK